MSYDNQSPSMSESRLLNLPAELLDMVLSYCDESSLYELSQTCRGMNELIVPLLYNTVDLSTDNPRFYPGDKPESRRRVLHVLFDGYDHPVNYSTYQVTNWWRAQRYFIRTIMTRPELGLYVRHFSWTLYSKRTWLEIRYPWVVSGNDQEHPVIAALKVFQRLSNVQSLRLDGLGPNVLFEQQLMLLLSRTQGLFSTATEVVLSGDLTLSLSKSILHTLDPAKLTVLELDNILDATRPYGSIPFNSGTYKSTPLLGLLQHLKGRCVSLKRLSLRKMGFKYPMGSLNYRAMDNALYEEYASFLFSVRPSLQSFVFEQVEAPVIVGPLPPGAVQPIRPMDMLFIQFFFPPLLTGGWPCLERVTIRGVRTKPNDLPVNEAMKSSMQRALGSRVSISIQEHAEKLCNVSY